MCTAKHAGLTAAITRTLQGSSHQRSRVHFVRNVLAHVAKGEREMVAAVFCTIFPQPDLASMARQWDKVRDKLAVRYPKIGAQMDTPSSRSSRSRRSRGSNGARSGAPARSSAQQGN